MADRWMETAVEVTFTAYGRMHPDGTTEWEVDVPPFGRMTEDELARTFKTPGDFVNHMADVVVGGDWTPMENEDDGA
jgi:hypothetical protein